MKADFCPTVCNPVPFAINLVFDTVKDFYSFSLSAREVQNGAMYMK